MHVALRQRPSVKRVIWLYGQRFQKQASAAGNIFAVGVRCMMTGLATTHQHSIILVVFGFMQY
jgi:hypothetical protein